MICEVTNDGGLLATIRLQSQTDEDAEALKKMHAQLAKGGPFEVTFKCQKMRYFTHAYLILTWTLVPKECGSEGKTA